MVLAVPGLHLHHKWSRNARFSMDFHYCCLWCSRKILLTSISDFVSIKRRSWLIPFCRMVKRVKVIHPWLSWSCPTVCPMHSQASWSCHLCSFVVGWDSSRCHASQNWLLASCPWSWCESRTAYLSSFSTLRLSWSVSFCLVRTYRLNWLDSRWSIPAHPQWLAWVSPSAGTFWRAAPSSGSRQTAP